MAGCGIGDAFRKRRGTSEEDMVVEPEDVKSRFYAISLLPRVVGSGEEARQGIWNPNFMIISYYH